jgi:magnesium transporter
MPIGYLLDAHGMARTKPLKSELEEPVTQHMRTEFSRLNPHQTISEALADIRSKPHEGRIIYFYVVDNENRLLGIVPTRRLLLSPETRRIEEIMVRKLITIGENATVLDACEFFLLHRLLAFPVVNANKQILGIVDVELYTDELLDLDRREANEDLFQLIGVHLSEAQRASPTVAFRSRFPWLLANIGGGILAAFLTGLFKVELEQVVALALFIPVVLALAESVAIQSVSLSLQALHGKRPTVASIFSKLKRESMTGLLLGIACALTVGLVASVWLQQWVLTLCVLGGITGGVTSAALIGVAMPNLLRLFDREPQVAAGPVSLALTDMVTLGIYFLIARVLL